MTRTTVVMEDNLLKKIKKLALENQKTFKDTLVELIQAGLSQKKIKKNKKKFILKTFKSGGSSVSIHDRNALFTRMGERL